MNSMYGRTNTGRITNSLFTYVKSIHQNYYHHVQQHKIQQLRQFSMYTISNQINQKYNNCIVNNESTLKDISPPTYTINTRHVQATHKNITRLFSKLLQYSNESYCSSIIHNTSFYNQRLNLYNNNNNFITSYNNNDNNNNITIRSLMTENQFHPIADETLETIQDTIDNIFETITSIDYEISYSSGVLNFKLSKYGTWVLNKQTPNKQIWVRFIIYISINI